MEVLYPDVVGSGGAPKRIMKPRRKTDGQPCDDTEMPGTGVLNLQADSTPLLVQDAAERQSQPPPSPQKSSQNQAPVTISSASGTQQRPTTAPSVPRNLTAGQATVLTPPEDSQPQSRKRPSPMASLQSVDFPQQASGPALSQSALPNSPEKRRRLSHRDDSASSASLPTPLLASSLPATGTKSTPDTRSRPETQAAHLQTIIEALDYFSKASRSRMWREEAVDLLFKDFADEDADLKINISENVLSDEHKAMVFCKMPLHLRQHWIKKLRGNKT